MARLVGSAIGRATTALLDADLSLAESVISADSRVDDLGLEAGGAILARQQPERHGPAGRRHLAADGADLETGRPGRARRPSWPGCASPKFAVPGDLHRTILEMGQLAQRLMAQAAEVITTKDVDAALRLEEDDDRMERAAPHTFQHLMDDRWKRGAWAVDVALVGRYYERFTTMPCRSPVSGLPGHRRACPTS